MSVALSTSASPKICHWMQSRRDLASPEDTSRGVFGNGPGFRSRSTKKGKGSAWPKRCCSKRPCRWAKSHGVSASSPDLHWPGRCAGSRVIRPARCARGSAPGASSDSCPSRRRHEVPFWRPRQSFRLLLRCTDNTALISALFEQQIARNVTLWRTGCAEVRGGVVNCGDARVRAGRLHASDALTDVECQFEPKGPAVAGPSALCAGGYSRDLSPAYCRLHAQGATRHDPGRYQCTLSVLRPAGRQGGPLRRDGGRGSAGVVRRRDGRPYG